MYYLIILLQLACIKVKNVFNINLLLDLEKTPETMAAMPIALANLA
jgi:hypothetical protein